MDRLEAVSRRPILQPGPEHPITIEPSDGKIVVWVAGRVIADTQQALTLREADYPPVFYVPLEDVESSSLEASDHIIYCPYKGHCSYYSIPIGGEKSLNAVWEYKQPYDAVAEIKDHVAFYPDRVERIQQQRIAQAQSPE